MTKLTTEITIEELQYRIHAHENDLTQMWTADYFLSVQKELLAMKQAAKNPVAWIVHMRTGDQFTTDGDFVGLGEATHGIHSTPLYAAPVLPKQPEPTISFYRDGIIAAAKWVESQREAYDNEHGQHDSDTGSFEFGNDAQLEYSTTLLEIAEGIRSLHPASAQPVSEPYKLPRDWIEGQFAYQNLFNAIAAVVSKHPNIEISIKALDNSMLAAAPAQESE